MLSRFQQQQQQQQQRSGQESDENGTSLSSNEINWSR
jgi:hypothetical protein